VAYIVTVVLLLLALTQTAWCADGVVSKWDKGGWDVTSTLTDSGTPEGTQITLEASVTYFRDDVQYDVQAEPVILTVGKSTIRKEWVISNPLDSAYKVEFTNTGLGGCEIMVDGKLRWWVTATNNGQPSVFTYRIRYSPP
jgi:hypothetical protein